MNVERKKQAIAAALDVDSNQLSQESVSTLFKTWQEEDCLGVSMDLLDPNPSTSSSQSSVRDVFESSDPGSDKFSELPPLPDNKPKDKNQQKKRQRPLCTFLNHFGTRLYAFSSSSSSVTSRETESDLVSEVSSLPSLDDEDVLAKRFSFGPDMSLVLDNTPRKKQKTTALPPLPKMPEIDPRLKDDPKLKDMQSKLKQLFQEIRKTRLEMTKHGQHHEG